MKVPRQFIALLILLAASAVSSYGQAVSTSMEAQPSAVQAEHDLQKTGNSQSDSAAQGTSQTTNQDYIFPTRGERFNRYVKNTIGPFSLLGNGVSAGINQWRDEPEEWKQGMSGYGKRFASSWGKTAIKQTVIYGLDSAMELDTGFKRSTRKGFGPRMKDALLENITSRKPSGKRVVSVPRFAGIYSGQIIAYETWYPTRYDYKDGLRSGTYSVLTGFGINLIREFIIKR